MDELPWMLAVSALGTGAVFGYVIQRGGFCLTRALSNAVLMRDGNILRAYRPRPARGDGRACR